MFMQSPIEGISLQTGIRLAHSTFGRCSHDTKTFPYEPGSTIELADTICTTNTTHTQTAVPYNRRKVVTRVSNITTTTTPLERFVVLLETLNRVVTNSAFTNRVIFRGGETNEFLSVFSNCAFHETEETARYKDYYGQELIVFRFSYGQQTFGFLIIRIRSVAINVLGSILFVRVGYFELDFDRNEEALYFAPILVVVVFTVRALYAGTLVTCWTTAPSHQKRRSSSALLAALCLFLATLTIAARCYASKNATHPLAQFSSQPQILSSIITTSTTTATTTTTTTTTTTITKDSKFQTHSSKIVLSRFFRIPYKDTQSDTRLILRNSKNLLSNQNFKFKNSTYLNADVSRRKREQQTVQEKVFSNFKSYDGKPVSNENSALYDIDVHSKHFVTTEEPYTVNNRIPTDEDASYYLTRTSGRHYYSRNRAATSYGNGKSRIPSRNLEAEGHSAKFLTDSNLNKKNHSNVAVASVNNSDTSAWNASVNASRVSDTLQVDHRQNDQSSEPLAEEEEERSTDKSDIERPMPPALDHSNNSLSSESAVLVLVVSAVVLTVALGLVTCVLSHYRGGTAADPHDAGQTPTTAPMLSVVSAGAAAGVGGMDRLRGRGAARELAATRDRQVRLHAVHTDIAKNLPPNIALPDGEDHPYTSSRLQIRDPEQESEIYQKCIKPPPNRTVLDSESPPPYRSSSAGLLGSIGSSSSGSSDWSGGSAPLVTRCHSMSSTSKRPEAGPSGQKTDFIQRTVKIFTGKKSQPPPAPTLPAVVVPTRPRQTTSEQQQQQQNSSGRPKPSV